MNDEPPMLDRLTLHAYQMTIPIDLENDEVMQTFVAPLDKKFASAVKLLTKHTKNIAPGFENDEIPKILTVNIILLF